MTDATERSFLGFLLAFTAQVAIAVFLAWLARETVQRFERIEQRLWELEVGDD